MTSPHHTTKPSRGWLRVVVRKPPVRFVGVYGDTKLSYGDTKVLLAEVWRLVIGGTRRMPPPRWQNSMIKCPGTFHNVLGTYRKVITHVTLRRAP